MIVSFVFLSQDFNVCSHSIVLTACLDAFLHDFTDPRTWSVKDVGQWLRMMDMASLSSLFESNDIDGTCLADGLDEQTLEIIGVRLPAHRRKLQSAVAKLFAAQDQTAFA